MSNMFLVRELLIEAKKRTANQEVIDLIDQAIANSYREYVKKRAPCESQRITRHLANQILNDYYTNEKQSCMTLAKKWKVNAGRVSELISGKHVYS